MNTSPEITDQQLAARIAGASLLQGNFALRSGRTSTYYLDKYRFSTQPEILRELGKRFARIIDTEQTDRLAGAELGGIPLVTVASLHTGLPAVFVRNQKKSYGTANQIEGILNKGDRIIIVEDILTTGGQVIEAADTLKSLGAQITKIIAVIDRQEGAEQNIQNAGYTMQSLFTKTDLCITPD